jgi:hypothetical protein
MTRTRPTDKDEPLNDVNGAEVTGAHSIEYIDDEHFDDPDWLQLASIYYTASRDFQDAALTRQWERNADHFNSQHYRRSVYNTPMYRGRSRIFRPLSRSAERASSAQFASAMFSNMQLVDVQAENQNDPMQLASARIMQKLVQYRLEKTIPWYLTCMGAWQDTRVYGPTFTYVHWKYAEAEEDVEEAEVNVLGDEIEGRTRTVRKVIPKIDEPAMDMLPPENCLLDPQCDWRDPINSSIYCILLWPMAVDDIVARMNSIDLKTGQPEWIPHSREEIESVNNDNYNAVRQSREGDNRPDKTDAQDTQASSVAWVHENFVRIEGEEYVYWTLGTQFMLTKPVPLKSVYHTGKRPVTCGYSVIEAHKFMPSSPTELISGLQRGVNDISNLRYDNVRLALNKRYFVRRGAQIDLESLMRSVPGGAVVTDDPERDVQVINTPDVTGSSYKEQERLETESNDLTGTFMGGSIQNNRALNQTVGGMELLSEGAGAISEFDIRTFVESWVKPTLELLIQNIQAYETDETIMHVAFEEAFKELGYKYDLNREATEDALRDDKFIDKTRAKELKNKVLNDKLTIKVNVGLGATSPQRKLDMINTAIGSVMAIPGQEARINGDEVIKEIFAAAGFQDGSRFIKGMGAGEEKQELTEQDLQAAYEQGMQAGTDQAKMANVEVTKELGIMKLEQERELRLAEIAAKENMSVQNLAAKVQIEQTKDTTRRDVEAVKSKNMREELNFKRTTGKPGI